MRLWVVIFLLSQLFLSAQEVHVHRFYYLVNDRPTEPKRAEIFILQGTDTLARLSGQKRFLLPEVTNEIKLLFRVDNHVLQAGPFAPDLLSRGSKLSFFHVNDASFLLRNTSYFYQPAKEELQASKQKADFEKALIVVIESDELKKKGVHYKRNITGRFKLFFKK